MPIIKLERTGVKSSLGKKIGLGVLGAGALGLGAYGISKLLKKRKGVGGFLGLGKKKATRSNTALRNSIQRIKLKRLKIVEQRKLFKEQLRA